MAAPSKTTQTTQLSQDEQDSEGKTALHRAVILQNVDLVKKLVGQGCRLDLCDNEGFTALHYSEENSDIEKFLLSNKSPIRGCREIHLAAGRGDVKKIEEILLKDPHQLILWDINKESPLFYAAKSGHEIAVKLLIDRGAWYEWSNTQQKNLVDVAKSSKNPALVAYLEKRIAVPDKVNEMITKSFKDILEKEWATAKKLNKKLMVILGEVHGIFSIRELEKQFLKIAKDIGINHLMYELPSINGGLKSDVETYAQGINLTVNRVDNHVYRHDASLGQRNLVMTTKVRLLDQDCVMIVGAKHLKGIVSIKSVKLPPEKFHVVPFNLAPIAANGTYGLIVALNKDKMYIDDDNNIIQVSHAGVSKHDAVITKFNTDKINPKQPKIIIVAAFILMAIAFCFPIYALYLYAGVLRTIGIALGLILGGYFASVFTEREKTYGLKEHKEYAKDDKSVVYPERFKAFMDGTHNTALSKLTSLFRYRDWRYMRDYYAGCAAKETEKEKLIQSVKARIK